MISRGVLFEKLSPAPWEWSNLLNLAVGAVSAAAQVGGRVERSKSFSPLSLFWGSLRERPVATTNPAAQRAPLLLILTWLPWLPASPALRIHNERFKEQLRQVQAYLMSLKQKEILRWTGQLEINFPFAALISARWAERLGPKAPVSPLRDGLYLGLLHRLALTPWLIKALKLIHKQHDTDLSFTTLRNTSHRGNYPVMAS